MASTQFIEEERFYCHIFLSPTISLFLQFHNGLQSSRSGFSLFHIAAELFFSYCRRKDLPSLFPQPQELV